MSWTDEKVEKLKELWAAGQTANQIASVITGVTRNAVIGKVHRLGLSNRNVEPEPPVIEKNTETPVRPSPVKKIAALSPKASSASVIKNIPKPEIEDEDEDESEIFTPVPATSDNHDPERIKIVQAAQEAEKNCKKLSLIDLTDRTCRWPIGIPTEDDFYFCGLPIENGKPYCQAHSCVAFQALGSRKNKPRHPTIRISQSP